MSQPFTIPPGCPDHVLRLSGDLDVASADVLRSRLGSLPVTSASIVCLDMRGVGFMDSTGVHVLTQLVATLTSGCVIVHEPTRAVARLLALTGLDREGRLHVVPSTDGA